ncbi:hypothetical protein SAMN02910447_02700 [Ruminococcus sp. YE71]|uniref:hypothetical protein n=1 Tax=unclassified Ruminococcus TaxID=2608920 RepID=UPI000889C478|nr:MULTISPECIES: hypothetical protein [unclassified Ruminococcus]SDA26718.1 hypothetical protein SAMN02910446_02686 [Ruminococcus sp. YE78]SFW44429.1 hypothetical protein SAMN02910447_02700 [Ruminococcus sp. YE71]
MKKAFALILTGVLMASPLTAFAEITENTDPKQGSTEITTQIAPAYIVTIPADTSVDFNTVNTDFGAVKLTKAQLEPNKCIKVTMTASGEMKNSADTSKVLPYTIFEGTADAVTDTVFTSAELASVGDKTDLTISISADDWNNAYAGSYSDTVLFSIEYADAQP